MMPTTSEIRAMWRGFLTEWHTGQVVACCADNDLPDWLFCGYSKRYADTRLRQELLGAGPFQKGDE